jgi:hypothetical protein
MFVVFAVWAVLGFPAEPAPLALNVISKILCFIAAIMLFVWRPDEEGSAARAPRSAQETELESKFAARLAETVKRAERAEKRARAPRNRDGRFARRSS